MSQPNDSDFQAPPPGVPSTPDPTIANLSDEQQYKLRLFELFCNYSRQRQAMVQKVFDDRMAAILKSLLVPGPYTSNNSSQADATSAAIASTGRPMADAPDTSIHANLRTTIEAILASEHLTSEQKVDHMKEAMIEHMNG